MAWTTPKIDSIPADGLDNVHLNKIEDNLKFLAGGTDTIAQSTSAATANALGKRDANADIAFRDIAVRDVNASRNVNASGNINAVDVNASGNISGAKMYTPTVGEELHVAGLAAGDNAIAVNSLGAFKALLTYTLKKTYRTKYSGTLRIKFGLSTEYAVTTAYGRIYKNGAPYGTERSTVSTETVMYSEDLAFADGDTIEFWVKTSNSSYYCFMPNISINSSATAIAYGWV